MDPAMDGMPEAAPQINHPEEFRSYIIVALTVQTPLHVIEVGGRFTDERYTVSVGPIPGETHTIIQPGGRLAAQACHVTDLITSALLKKYLRHELSRPGAFKRIKKTELFWETDPTPLTRIILAARDSYELVHVGQLLRKAGIAVHQFEDNNEEAYGPGVNIVTAIGTEPIHKEDTIGLIDYLPPWTPDKTDRPRL